jgi:hypothetical protein
VRTIVFVQPSSESLNKGSPRFGARLILNGNMSNGSFTFNTFTFNTMEVSQMKNVFELYLDHPPDHHPIFDRWVEFYIFYQAF